MILLLAIIVATFAFTVLSGKQPGARKPLQDADPYAMFRASVREGSSHWLEYYRRHCESPAEIAFLEAAIAAFGLVPVGAPGSELKSKSLSLRLQVKVDHYRLDFLANNFLVIEIDGAAYHSSPEAQTRDAERDRYLIGKGYVVLRIPAKIVLYDVHKAIRQTRAFIAIWGWPETAQKPELSATSIQQGAVNKAVERYLRPGRAAFRLEKHALSHCADQAGRSLGVPRFSSQSELLSSYENDFVAWNRSVSAYDVSLWSGLSLSGLEPPESPHDWRQRDAVNQHYRDLCDERESYFLELVKWMRSDSRIENLIRSYLADIGCSASWEALVQSGAPKRLLRELEQPRPHADPTPFAIEEEWHRRRVVSAWSGERATAQQINTLVGGLTARMQKDPAVAAYHIPLIKEIADDELPVPAARLAMADCYRRGNGVAANPQLALNYLERAAGTGDNHALWWYANHLINNEGLEDVLSVDIDKALSIFRQLIATLDLSIYELALWSAVPLLIKGKSSGQLSPEDEEIVRSYSDSHNVHSIHFYELARFYSTGVASNDYLGLEYRRARELAIRGVAAGSTDSKAKCLALLSKWGIAPE